jgi:hypothetical protein
VRFPGREHNDLGADAIEAAKRFVREKLS